MTRSTDNVIERQCNVEKELQTIREEIEFWMDCLYPVRSFRILASFDHRGHRCFCTTAYRGINISLGSGFVNTVQIAKDTYRPTEVVDVRKWPYINEWLAHDIAVEKPRYYTGLIDARLRVFFYDPWGLGTLKELGINIEPHIIARIKHLTEECQERMEELNFLSSDLVVQPIEYVKRKRLYNRFLGIYLENNKK